MLSAVLLAGCGGGAEAPEPAAPEPASSSTSASASASDSGQTPLASLPPLVADARWVTRDGETALRVSPTDYLRNHPSRDVADEAWRRVVVAIPEADTPGMQDQFVCHAQFASAKQGWYLEPRRPAVGYGQTVLAGCNPGDVRDVG